MHLAVVIIHSMYLTWSTGEGGSAVQKLPWAWKDFWPESYTGS